jgi:hypothetical protein
MSSMATNVDIPRAVANFRFFAGAIRHDETSAHQVQYAAVFWILFDCVCVHLRACACMCVHVRVSGCCQGGCS